MGNSGSSFTKPLGIPPVPVLDIENSLEKPSRVLRHCLKANHNYYSILYNKRRFHNHLPHALGSAYLLGASDSHLKELYEYEIRHLEPWESSPEEVTSDDWREFLGDKSYQRSYVDFFDDEVMKADYDWKAVVLKYMLEFPNPLIYGAFGGLGHPLIHLGYAFELNSKEVAVEALALATTNWNFLHKYINDDFPGPGQYLCRPLEDATEDPFELIGEIFADNSFKDLFPHKGAGNILPLFEAREELVISYYHRLTINDTKEAHRQLTRLATLLLCTTHTIGLPEYDFFICHLLTTAYAVRTLLPELSAEFAYPLLKAHWLFIIVVYIAQLRPAIQPHLIEEVDHHCTWRDVVKKALGSDVPGNLREMEDAHYIKAIRALKESADLWQEDACWYLKAAVKFAFEFKDWSGFGVMDEDESKYGRDLNSLTTQSSAAATTQSSPRTWSPTSETY